MLILAASSNAQGHCKMLMYLFMKTWPLRYNSSNKGQTVR